jgi:peptidoglycan/LPS O-acetylase OafA/YrhL
MSDPTHRQVACLALLGATAVSAAFQAYRTAVGTNPAVDRFGIDTAVGYLVLVALALAVRSDRRPVWWLLAVVMAALLVYAVVGYYPGIYRARPMDRVDWLEGTVFTAALGLVLTVAALRLAGRSLVTGVPAPGDVAPAQRSG